MKPFLIWRNDWLLGYENLDKQHLELAATLNKLHHFISDKKNKKPCAGMDQICQQLTTLRETTRHHFQYEEALMQEHGFPGLAEHHREHVMLLAELKEYIREIETGSKHFSLKILTALKHWQIDHVIYSDRKFVDYLRCQPRSKCKIGFSTISGGQSIGRYFHGIYKTDY